MNQIDKKRLRKLGLVLSSVPFPKDGMGTSTQSVEGMVGYQNDMRNLMPNVRKVLEGMLLEGVEGMIEGDDYENPDTMLDIIYAWIEKRKQENWCNVSDWDFQYFRSERDPKH